MKNITILYFAKLREEANKRDELLKTDANTAIEVFNFLKEKYNFSLSEDYLRVAINDEFAEWDDRINDNDILVFIQPVAGG